MIKLRRHPYLLLLPVLLACAESGDDSLGGGGQGGDASTVTTGGSTTTTTVGPTSTASSTVTTTVTTTTSSSGGGGEGGEGGMMNEGGAPPAEYVLETEPNNTQGQANDLPDGAPGFAAEITSSNDFDVFAVEAVIGSTMTVTVSDGYGGCPSDANVNVQIFGPLDTEIAAASGLCPELDGSDPDLLSLADTGTYFVRVTAAQPVNSYAIDITVSPPVCGDGFEQLGEECDDGNLVDGDGCEADCTVTPVCGDSSIQVGEECDDGNTNNGDGCDSTCQFEGNVCPETEANNSIATANVGPTCTAWMGQIGTIGDVDYFAVPVTVAGSRIEAEVVDLGGVPATCPAGFDSELTLYGAAMNQLAYDDDDALGTGNCSLIHQAGDAGSTNLPVGTYYLAVNEYSDDATSPQYRLRVAVIAPGCGDGVLQVGEQCDDGNTADGDGCSSTCQVLSCGPTEVAVTLSATDLPQNIDDADTVTPALSTINVAQAGTVTQLALRLDIDHNYMGDVEVSLDPPAVAESFLVDNIGSSNDDMVGTIFSSLASTSITSGSPPWTGVWSPQGSFAPIIGSQASGAWVVKALDNAGGIAGVLNGYTLHLCVQP